MDYREAKAARIRKQEINSCLSKIEKKLEKVEIKQEAIDYFENSLIFRFEEIMQKLLSNPGKGFDEIIAEFVASALADIETPPAAKDLILSTLLLIDRVDLAMLKQLDLQWKHNLFTEQKKLGVTQDILAALLKSSGIDSIMISRSIQRLESENLIHPLNSNTATIQELPEFKELFEGEKSNQFDSPSGYVTSAYGRRFLRFLKLSD